MQIVWRPLQAACQPPHPSPLPPGERESESPASLRLASVRAERSPIGAKSKYGPAGPAPDK